MGIKRDYEQAFSDYKYLCEHHDGNPDDLTGGFQDGEAFDELLASPSKKTALSILISLISYSAYTGFEDAKDFTTKLAKKPDLEDSKMVEIYRRWNCEHHILRAWGIDIEEQEDD